MNRGYTKRWRKRWDRGYHKDAYLWLLMDYFIDHANYKDSDVFINGKFISIKRGQHIFGRSAIAEFLGVNSSLVYRKLKILEKINFLSIESNNRFSIATVINYDTYQPQKNEIEQPTEHHTEHHTEQQTNSQPNTPKEVNKEKEIKNKKSEGFALPSEEILKEGSILKINSDIEAIVEKLYEERIFPKVHAFKNKMLKVGKNERAILHTLTRCYLAKNRLNGNAWAYCTKIMQIENGNYNESDYNKTA